MNHDGNSGYRKIYNVSLASFAITVICIIFVFAFNGTKAWVTTRW